VPGIGADATLEPLIVRTVGLAPLREDHGRCFYTTDWVKASFYRAAAEVYFKAEVVKRVIVKLKV
jgi:hypothetical protein